MPKWDYYRNEPVDAQNIKDYVSDLSRQAQAAELAGNQVKADYLHHGINRELEALQDEEGK